MPDMEEKPKTTRLEEEAKFFESPWTEATSKIRRNLLVAATVGLIMAAAGIVPSEISAFGLKVSDIDQAALSIIICLIVLYFLVSFAFSAYSDLMCAKWEEMNIAESSAGPVTATRDNSKQTILLANPPKHERMSQRLKNVHDFRLVVIDLIVPIVVGIVAFVWLLVAFCRGS